MTSTKTMARAGQARKVAFALGGLAGNNAHGAGFLQAALDRGVVPVMISCTSGQIRWVAQYLKARSQPAEAGQALLREHLAAEIAHLRPTGEINTDLALLALFGRKDYFRVAYDHVLGDWWQNLVRANAEALAQPGQVLRARHLLSQCPARTLVPEFKDTYFQSLADVFNGETEIGIAFNAYDPQHGVEHVYLNGPARAMLQARSESKAYTAGTPCEHRPERIYRDIDAAALRQALWLYQYGFEDAPRDGPHGPFVDGAYFRDIMLAELIVADVIYAVRPMNRCWLGPLPTSYPALEDLKTEVAFNGGYAAERDQIELVNKLLRKGRLHPDVAARYHPIELKTVEVQTQRSYFEYIFESMDVFDAARVDALCKLD